MSPPLKRIRVTEPQSGPVASPSSLPPPTHGPQAGPPPPDGLRRRMQQGLPLPAPRRQGPPSFEAAPAAAAASPMTRATWDGNGPAPGLSTLFPDIWPPAQPDAAEPAPVRAPASPSGNLHFQADPGALDAALSLVALSSGHVAAPGDEPPVPSREDVTTPKGKHVSVQGAKRLQDLWNTGAWPSKADIARQLNLTQSAVGRAIRSKRNQVTEGHLTPQGKNLTDSGRQAIVTMNQQNPDLTAKEIGRALGLDPRRVRRVLADEAALAAPEGMRTPGGWRLTKLGKQEIVRRYDADPSTSLRALARSLKVSHASVIKALAERTQGDATAAAPAPIARAGPRVLAPLRPLVRVADWGEVANRSWNAGDRFTLPMEGGPALFELTRNRQQGDPIRREDFRPILRGG